MARSDVLTFEQLLDWVEGRLGEQEAATVAAQVAVGDATVQAEVAWVRAFLHLGDTLIVEDPPEQVHQILQERFAEHWQTRRESAAATNTPAGFFQRLRAALTFDSHLQLGLAGARGTESTATRQLIYSTELVDVALNLRHDPTTQRVTLLGQILPTTDPVPLDLAAFSIQLLQDEAEVDITLADTLGEFTFTNLTLGVYDLSLSTDQLDLLLSPITLAR